MNETQLIKLILPNKIRTNQLAVVVVVVVFLVFAMPQYIGSASSSGSISFSQAENEAGLVKKH